MINLMPTESIKQLRAARTNTILLRYTIIVILAGIFANVILAGSYFLLTQTKNSQQALIEANVARAEDYSDTQQEINRLSTTLSGARTVLDQQILYSQALQRLGSSMPTGTILRSVALKPENFNGTPLTLQVYAKSNDAAVSLRQQLAASPYFTNASLDSITETGGIDDYPVSASLTLTLNRSIAQ